MNIPSSLQRLSHPTHDLRIKRDDLIHPIICGNKRRKISGYLQQHFPQSVISSKVERSYHGSKRRFLHSATLQSKGQKKTKASNIKSQSYNSILTFGGAYSNHLRAIAHVGVFYNIGTIGIVRGEELATKPLNDNLQFCQDQGMELHFIDRQTYRQIKTSPTQEEIDTMYPFCTTCTNYTNKTLIIPEGGCGPAGLIGTHQIIDEIASQKNTKGPVYFCIEAGTGTTAAGCIQAISDHQLDRHTVAIPVLHDLPTITQTIERYNPHTTGYDIIAGYEHGGYAKTTPKLLSFIDDRTITHDIHIEPTYSGKLCYAIYDLIQQGYFPPDATIIIYHSGY